jgi:membrane fusion protein (multidrug efflux system)
METARLSLDRTTIRAPIDGVVTQLTAQVGQRFEVGQPLMIVAPLQDAYVDANFKEGQLRRVEIGQPVELTSDLYGERVTYHGRVEGIGGGTGSAFAVIPAQNATGNWIRVVQRVPVRISLDPRELAEHPLRVGLSMEARIDVRDPPETDVASN